MAARIKTIEYAFALATADVNSATARDFTSFTMYIPESSPVFKSVILEMTAYDTATAASVTAVLMGISLGAVARDDLTVTQTITNSGENQAFIFTRDVTDYFTTNWTGTSMTVGSRLTITGVGTRSCTSKLIITYQYDDTDTTQIKTVRIPMEGNTGNLTTSLANLGGVASQIPALSTWLPETSKVIRDIFFETYTHTGKDAGTTDRALNMSFNSGTNTLSATYESGLATDYPIKRIDKLISGTTPLYSTGSAWSVQASTANVDMPFPCLSGIYVVTYEFNASTTTEVMNSLLLPIVDEDGYVTDVNNVETYSKDIFIQEPNAISLEQSAILFSCIDSGAVTIDLTIGAQTSRQYVHGATTSRAGAMYMMRRFDAGAVEDSGISLVRGRNTVDLNYYTTSTTAGSRGSNSSAVMIFNYKSGKSPQGIGAHNKTSIWCVRPYTATTPVQQIVFDAARPPEIPDTDINTFPCYWITCNGYCSQLLTTGGTSATLATALQVYKNPSANSTGWANLYSCMYNSDAEIGPSIMWNTCKGTFAQWQDDYRRGRDILETATPLTLRYDQLTAIGHIQVQKYLTYHSITSSISGVVSNFLNPSFVEAQVEITDGIAGSLGKDVYGIVAASTVDSNGNYSGLYWYDDTVNLKVNVIEFDSNNNIFRVGETKAQPISGSTFNVELAKNPTTYYSFG